LRATAGLAGKASRGRPARRSTPGGTGGGISFETALATRRNACAQRCPNLFREFRRLDLGELAYPVDFDLAVTPGTPGVGEEVTVTMEIATKGGRAIKPTELAVTHTELMHVLVIDETREDYHHIHPEPIGHTGTWQFSFTPRRAANYRIFAEVVPSRTQQIVIAAGTLNVAGEETGHDKAPAGLPEGWRASLEVSPTAPVVNTEAHLRLSLAREDGGRAILEPVMAAYAHLVAFDPELRGFAHLHPKYTGNEKGDAPELDFVLNTHIPGNYRIWAQVKVDGTERFIPFDIGVRDKLQTKL